MQISIGTFNLNNLFSRYNFKGEVNAIESNSTTVNSQISYEFTDKDVYRLRTFMGKLVKPKNIKNTQTIADRILRMNVDVLAVQEVEDIDILKQFNNEYLNGLYKYVILIEGNDPRLIDVGILSKYPIGQIVSWQQAVHNSNPNKKVFGRDLLQVNILSKSREKKLFTIFNNHLKSQFVPFGQNKVKGTKSNNLRRKHQSEVIKSIVLSEMRPNSKFIILGDMNDSPKSAPLKPFVKDTNLDLFNALKSPKETRPPKHDTPMPLTTAWTHRFKESGKPAKYELFDQIWLSNSLKNKFVESWIDRRTKHKGDGSDHDPTWIILEL